MVYKVAKRVDTIKYDKLLLRRKHRYGDGGMYQLYVYDLKYNKGLIQVVTCLEDGKSLEIKDFNRNVLISREILGYNGEMLVKIYYYLDGSISSIQGTNDGRMYSLSYDTDEYITGTGAYLIV